MSHGHDHHHHHHAAGRALAVSSALTIAYVLGLMVVGLRAHSLALLSEAGHNFSDLLALFLSSAALYWQRRPADPTHTYGYHRAEVLAAFVNSASLVVISFWIVFEAFTRLLHPVEVAPRLIVWASLAGVAVNGVITLMLLAGHRDLNLKSALLHEIGDTLSTLVVAVGGLVIWRTGLNWIDPALSILIAVVICWSSFGILRESANILLEGAPAGVVLDDVAAMIASVEGVRGVHDLHVWSLGSQSHALSAHVLVDDQPLTASLAIRDAIDRRLASDFCIHHATLQFDHERCQHENGCILPSHASDDCPARGDGHGCCHDHDHDGHDHHDHA